MFFCSRCGYEPEFHKRYTKIEPPVKSNEQNIRELLDMLEKRIEEKIEACNNILDEIEDEHNKRESGARDRQLSENDR